jgi:hypothetical protein
MDGGREGVGFEEKERARGVYIERRLRPRTSMRVGPDCACLALHTVSRGQCDPLPVKMIPETVLPSIPHSKCIRTTHPTVI